MLKRTIVNRPPPAFPLVLRPRACPTLGQLEYVIAIPKIRTCPTLYPDNAPRSVTEDMTRLKNASKQFTTKQLGQHERLVPKAVRFEILGPRDTVG